MSDAPAKHLPHGNYRRADHFEAECTRLAAELAATRSGNPYICSFCAWTTEPPDAYAKGRDHMSVCERHPMRATEARVAALEAALRELYDESPHLAEGLLSERIDALLGYVPETPGVTPQCDYEDHLFAGQVNFDDAPCTKCGTLWSALKIGAK